MICSEEWEQTYLRLVRIVTNPGKFAKVMKKWNLHHDSRILDLCCGNGGTLDVFRRAGYRNLTGLDVSNNLLKRAKNNIPLVQADANHCPFREDIFDAIIIHKALHHFLDLDPLITEVKRLLKPEGYFCFIEPRKTWFRDLYHVVLLSPLVNIIPPLVQLRNAALIEEGETYFKWLDNSHVFFNMLEKRFHFSTVHKIEDLCHYIVKCKSPIAPSSNGMLPERYDE